VSKKCNRCNGFIRIQDDHEGKYSHCLMCGKYENISFHAGVMSSNSKTPPKTTSKWSKSTSYYNK